MNLLGLENILSLDQKISESFIFPVHCQKEWSAVITIGIRLAGTQAKPMGLQKVTEKKKRKYNDNFMVLSESLGPVGSRTRGFQKA